MFWGWVFTGRIVLEALILTSAVVSSLTGYTFWASKKGKDFSYLGPILFSSLIILILTGFIQVKYLGFFKSMHTWLSPYMQQLTWWFLIFYCCADVLPTWIYICRCLWWTQCYHFLRLYCLWHRQPHKALHLRRLHLGIRCSLFGHSELVHCHHGDLERRVRRLIVWPTLHWPGHDLKYIEWYMEILQYIEGYMDITHP